MVLEVLGGHRPQVVIIGHACQQPQHPFLPTQSYWFEGVDQNGEPIRGYWADVGIAWVGIWHEDGEEYHFSFILNPANATPVTDDE